MDKKLSQKQPTKQQKNSKSFESGHSNRLGGLIYHPELISEHKEMIQNKISTINFARSFVEYAGCGLLILHMIKNRLRLSRSTGLYVAIPPLTSYLIKIFGYFWVDSFAERSGLYKIYKISTF